MRWTIARTLFAVLVLTSLATLALNTVFSQWRFQRDFLAYTGELDAEILANLAPAFVAHYLQHGNWSALQDDRNTWNRLLLLNGPRRGDHPAGDARHPETRPPGPPRGPRPGDARNTQARPPGPPPGPPGTEGRPGAGDPFDIGSRIGLYDATGNHISGAKTDTNSVSTEVICKDNIIVGELRLAPPSRLTNELDRRFAAGQRQSLVFVALAVLALAIPVALLLAKRLSRPVSELASRASAMTAGDYTPRIKTIGSGELADLADDLNRLALTLDNNRRTRRQWISDISHELRTPLAIILAELQALEDGIRQYDDATRISLQSEAKRLSRLVHDLYELSTSDEGRLLLHPEPFDVVPLLDECLHKARPRLADKGIELESRFEIARASVFADGARLVQLFNNLIENSLRYTDAPGKLRVNVESDADTVTINFDDSAPGVSDDQRERIFDRLFRVDASRSRASGGSGLGLAICRAIVEAHSGVITATESPLGGLSVCISLPVHEESD